MPVAAAQEMLTSEDVAKWKLYHRRLAERGVRT
jgi:hypothetical protein